MSNLQRLPTSYFRGSVENIWKRSARLVAEVFLRHETLLGR